jgi:hypothetical protein
MEHTGSDNGVLGPISRLEASAIESRPRFNRSVRSKRGTELATDAKPPGALTSGGRGHGLHEQTVL